MRSSSGPLSRDPYWRTLCAGQVQSLLAVAEVAAGARVHGGDQHDARREGQRHEPAADGDLAVLERLAQALERREAELGELVEEQHAEMGEAHLARARRAAAADQPRRRDGVMRRAERTLGDQRAVLRKEPRHAVDARDLDGLVEGERRHDAGQPPGEHGLARARRPRHEDVVGAGDGDLEGALHLLLTHDVGEVRVRRRPAAEERREVGRRRGRAAAGGELRDGLRERARRVHLETADQRGLGGVGRGQDQPAHAAPPQALGQRKRAGHGPQRAVQTELADRGQRPAPVAAVGGLAGGHQKGQGDGQVERRALLAQVGRRQIDGDASRRERDRTELTIAARTRSRLS